MIAQLIAAYRLFLDFAVEADAIAPSTAQHYATRAKEYLVELVQAQSEIQDQAKAGRLFLDLVAGACHAKRNHVANANSHFVPYQYGWASGWHKKYLYEREGQRLEWVIPENSKCVGYLDVDEGMVYLHEKEAVAVARAEARRQGLTQSFNNIGRELVNEKLCKVFEEAKSDGKKTRRSTQNKRIQTLGVIRCFFIPVKNIFGDPDPDEAVPTVPTPAF
jgi:hypothetical protein